MSKNKYHQISPPNPIGITVSSTCSHADLEVLQTTGPKMGLQVHLFCHTRKRAILSEQEQENIHYILFNMGTSKAEALMITLVAEDLACFPLQAAIWLDTKL